MKQEHQKEDPGPASSFTQSEGQNFEWEDLNLKSNVRRKNILAESQCLNSSYSTHTSVHSVLSLKQKVAQCMLIISRKDQTIQDLKDQIVKLEQIQKFNEKQNSELQETLQSKNNCIVEEKAALNEMKKNYLVAEQKIDNETFDKQLLIRQVNYYQSQIEALTSKIKSAENLTEDTQRRLKKQSKINKDLGIENERLQNDMKRLKILISETQKYKKFSTSIENKHYIGNANRSSCEKQNWVSTNVIQNVESLIKKKNGGKEKDMVNTMASFIQQYSENIIKKTQRKVKKMYSSKIKDIERKHNYSLSLMEAQGKRLGGKVGNQRKFQTMADSSIQDKFECAFPTKINMGSIELCIRILSELRKRIIGQISNKSASTNTVNILIDWAIESVSSNCSKEKLYSKSVCSSSTTNQITI